MAITVDIGFIGLGHMGFPIARRLVAAGHRVAFDTRGAAFDRLAAPGANPAWSPKEVVDAADTVLARLLAGDHADRAGRRRHCRCPWN